MNNLKTLLAMGVIASGLLAGCNGSLGAGDNGQDELSQGELVLMAESDTPIRDVPVPIFFKLDERKSRHYAAGNARYVDHYYRGRADKYAVVTFYRLQMARSRWVPVSDRGSGGVLTLDFDKGSERCVIRISDKFDLFRPTEVHLQMWTTGRLPPPPEGTP